VDFWDNRVTRVEGLTLHKSFKELFVLDSTFFCGSPRKIHKGWEVRLKREWKKVDKCSSTVQNRVCTAKGINREQARQALKTRIVLGTERLSHDAHR